MVLTLYSGIIETLTSSIAPAFERLQSPVDRWLIGRRYRSRPELRCYRHIRVTDKHNLEQEILETILGKALNESRSVGNGANGSWFNAT